VTAGLGHLYVLCKGGEDEVGGHSFSPGVIAVKQRSELCLQGNGCGANPSVGLGEVENPYAVGMSPHLYKQRSCEKTPNQNRHHRFFRKLGVGKPYKRSLHLLVTLLVLEKTTYEVFSQLQTNNVKVGQPPGDLIYKRYASRKGVGNILLSFPLSELRRLSATVGPEARIPQRQL